MYSFGHASSSSIDCMLANQKGHSKRVHGLVNSPFAKCLVLWKNVRGTSAFSPSANCFPTSLLATRGSTMTYEELGVPMEIFNSRSCGP